VFNRRVVACYLPARRATRVESVGGAQVTNEGTFWSAVTCHRFARRDLSRPRQLKTIETCGVKPPQFRAVGQVTASKNGLTESEASDE